ncbi:hypothetical protein MUN78_06930 [Leucobacter allii]|uniref:Minor tail protein n=1 Tax=Leucobacter allii TaxID=2932247 RepID=A0ABY4FQI5_9MICO|nr:hypothetical protein [Leucobacter allii]UOQ58550.1 hypothetical protein MUN78_06930 [Leucobacter allii]
MAIPGFPSSDYDWSGPEVAAALAGLIVRDMVGAPRPGILPSRPDLVRGRSDWSYDVSPFVAVRVDEREILIGPSVDLESVPTSPAPSANARIDVVYSRPAEIGAGETSEAVFVAQGAASAVPSKPALPAGAVELATFRVSAGNTNTSAAVATQTFPTTVCAGGVLPFRSTAEMTSFLAVPDQLAIVAGVLYRRQGSAWVEAVQKPREHRTNVPLAALAAGATRTVPVTFPSGRFTSTPSMPVITLRASGGSARGVSASISGMDAAGCNVNLVNDSESSRDVGAWVQFLE